MTINATGSRHNAEFIKESAYGVTPTTPAMTPFRLNTISLGLSKESFQSQELRSDRQMSDFRHGNQQVGGDIVSELSYGTFDEILEAALGGTWDADTPIVGTDQLKAGVVLSSFTIRRRFTDVSQVQVFTGCKFSKFSLAVNSQITTATFGIVGKAMSTSDIAGATVSPATTTSPFSGLDIGTINEGGVEIAAITELSLDVDNGINATFALGSPFSSTPQDGRSNITGSLTAYFQNQTLLDKFINETETSADFTIIDPSGNELKFTLPRIKYSGGQPDVGGEGVILLTMPFQALLDSATNTNIIIERTPA